MDTDTTTRNVWEFLEQPNDKAIQTEELYRWGLNCDHNANPFLVFLDLTGWSQDNYGERMITKPDNLGYMELDYLADALKEYACNPRGVTEWVDALMACEGV